MGGDDGAGGTGGDGGAGGDGACPDARDACIAAAGCVLELYASGVDGYRCRAAEDQCEGISNADACGALAPCEWAPGACYCPADVNCVCGGGPPDQCRVPVGCDTRVVVRNTGGLCQDGACNERIEWSGADSLSHDDQRPDAATRGRLSGDDLWALTAHTHWARDQRLPEGYGECCNAFADGNDTYVTVYVRGVARPEVRLSRRGEAPVELVRLVEVMERAGRRLRDDGGDGSVCEE
jgi:hypothetical protein